MRVSIVLVVVACMALFLSIVSSVDAKTGEFHAVTIEEPVVRHADHMAQMAQQIGLTEISSEIEESRAEQIESAEEASDLAEEAMDKAEEAEAAEEAALLETEASSPAPAPALPVTNTNFIMDDSEQHVWVEAQSESGISTMTEATKSGIKKAVGKAGKAVKKLFSKKKKKNSAQGAVVKNKMEKTKKNKKNKKGPLSASAAQLKKPIEKLINGNPTSAKELLVLSKPAAPGELPLSNTFPKGLTPQAAPEPQEIVNKRLKKAKVELDRLARQEHEAEHLQYKHELHKHQYAVQVEKARQSQKFERPLPPDTPRIPAASSNAAVMAGDRNHNILFPAATAKSDGKAPSQNHDFHHRGNGDLYYDHLNLVEHESSTNEEGENEEEWSAEAEEAAVAEADSQDAAVSASEAEARAPTLVKEPCADQCDAPGAWRSAACQDCIVRGMVNGWIVKSIQEQQKGYNYVHWARNKCVAYSNELHLRSSEVKGAPFAHCFFQKVHETCNL